MPQRPPGFLSHSEKLSLRCSAKKKTCCNLLTKVIRRFQGKNEQNNKTDHQESRISDTPGGSDRKMNDPPRYVDLSSRATFLILTQFSRVVPYGCWNHSGLEVKAIYVTPDQVSLAGSYYSSDQCAISPLR